MTQLQLVSDGDVQAPVRGPVVTIEVLGTPAPKGSSRAILIRGRAVNVPGGSNKNRTQLKSWDASIRETVIARYGELEAPLFVDRQLEVQLYFRLARPGGHWGKNGLKPSAPARPRGKPDIDKLVRATLDALIGCVMDDDSRIVRLVAEKHYAAPGHEGAEICVGELAQEASV